MYRVYTALDRIERMVGLEHAYRGSPAGLLVNLHERIRRIDLALSRQPVYRARARAYASTFEQKFEDKIKETDDICAGTHKIVYTFERRPNVSSSFDILLKKGESSATIILTGGEDNVKGVNTVHLQVPSFGRSWVVASDATSEDLHDVVDDVELSAFRKQLGSAFELDQKLSFDKAPVGGVTQKTVLLGVTPKMPLGVRYFKPVRGESGKWESFDTKDPVFNEKLKSPRFPGAPFSISDLRTMTVPSSVKVVFYKNEGRPRVKLLSGEQFRSAVVSLTILSSTGKQQKFDLRDWKQDREVEELCVSIGYNDECSKICGATPRGGMSLGGRRTSRGCSLTVGGTQTTCYDWRNPKEQQKT